MKKMITLCLALCMLLGVYVPSVSAAETTLAPQEMGTEITASVACDLSEDHIDCQSGAESDVTLGDMNRDGVIDAVDINILIYIFKNGKYPCEDNGHTYKKVEIPPTCEENGLQAFGCTTCGDNFSVELPALGHTEVISPAVPASCTQTGLTEGKHCSVCDEVLAVQEVVPALGHTEVISPAVPATCTQTGLTEGKHCSVCTEVLVAQTVVDALGHSYVSTVTPPTATKDGYTAYICACGDSYMGETVTPLSFTVTESNRADIGYTGVAGESLVIPAVFEKDGVWYRVTSIGSDAFYNCESLTSVVIPDSVTSIGNYAFAYCSNLTSITIGNGVTSIGGWVFYNCSNLTSVTIGSGVTSIGSYAFYNCSKLNAVYISDLAAWCGISFGDSYANPLYYANNLYLNGELVTELVIPDSVTRIGSYAFYYCYSLTSVVIPDSVTSIGSSAFLYCYKLVEVINKSSLSITAGSSDNGYVAYYAKEVHTGESKIVNQNDYLFYTYNGVNYLIGYAGNDTALTLPASYNGQSYEIYKYAFYSCSNLTSVVIPDSVTSIGWQAFYNCSKLTSVTIGSGVTSIGSYAFYNCTGLTNIVIPDSVTSIGSYAFLYCYKLVEVVNNSSLSITKGSSSNGYVAYYAKEVHTGKSKIVNQNDYLFYSYNGVNYLLGYVGTDTALTLPANYNGQSYKIYNYAFYDCDSLTSIVIPDSVTSIGDRAFYDCDSLTSIVIPDSVTSIGEGAFFECSNLTSIVFKDTTTWYCTTSYTDWKKKTNGTETSVTNASTNATNFRSTYYDYYWYKL